MKTVIITFGRFQGFHRGHQKIFKMMKTYSDLYGSADIKIYLSKTCNKINPLSYPIKKMHFDEIFHEYAKYVDDHQNNLMTILKSLNGIYDRVFFVCGSDRTENFQSFFDRYNEVEYNFSILRCVEVQRENKKQTGTFIRSIVNSLWFYWHVPGNLLSVHNYKNDLKTAILSYKGSTNGT